MRRKIKIDVINKYSRKGIIIKGICKTALFCIMGNLTVSHTLNNILVLKSQLISE